MKNENTSCQRVLTAACSSLVLLGITLLPLAAVAQTAPAAEQSTAVESTDNLTVVRDADTGKLRAPTPEEHQAMQGRADKLKDRRIGRLHTLPKIHSSGARGARLTDEMTNASVMVRMPDGSLQEQCHTAADSVNAGALVACHSTQKPELE